MNKWIVTPRQRCDLEMLLIGGFDPLSGFLSQADYEQVLATHRLTTGALWPIPITLDVSQTFAETIVVGDEIVLCDADQSYLAYMAITDKWKPDKMREADAVLGTCDLKHPGVAYLFHQAGDWYIGGRVRLIQVPRHYDFSELRLSPAVLKKHISQLGSPRLIGFQTRNPIHRAHFELTLRAAKKIDGHLLLHPTVGLTKQGDLDYLTRVRCYQHILRYYPPQKVTLSLLPLVMRMGGPKEALLHALIRKNYGCTHFIVRRDHAGPGCNSQGKLFYNPYAAQNLAMQHQDEIGIQIIAFPEMVYVKERKAYCLIDEVKAGEKLLTISGTELRYALLTDRAVPDWFSFPEVLHELRKAYPAKSQQGLTLFFTGLSGSGKTTLAQTLMSRLMKQEKRKITLLDDDLVRRMLASDLGFSKADRDLNIRRIGFVAAEITKVGGIALCAAIAPYANARQKNRQLISQYGGYIEVYVSTSFATCEERDAKGLYAKARSGELKNLTGLSDPYEPPEDADIIIDTAKLTLEKSVDKIMRFLQDAGYLMPVSQVLREVVAT